MYGAGRDASGSRDSDLVRLQRRVIKDYRLALGLDLNARRTDSGLTFTSLSERTNIPAETLRSYEKGSHQPQLVRLADIGNVYGVSAFDILVSTAEYIYRASGESIPDPTTVHPDRIALRAVILYCGVTPAQLRVLESTPVTKHADRQDWYAEQ